MSGGHVHSLFLPGDSPLHRAAPQCKIAAQLLFVFAVVATPREAFWAFAVYTGMVVFFARIGRVPLRLMVRRLVIEVPFLLFAVFLPVVGRGERIDVLGASLSVEGLWGAWNIFAKATLGLSAMIILASTTAIADLLRGLGRLHVPHVITAVAGFMVRYLEVISGEVRRMHVARISRGYDPRWIWQARAVASSAGSLFIRSFERGERVYLAMVSRGYEGSLPELREDRATRGEWAWSLTPPALAAIVALTAWSIVL